MKKPTLKELRAAISNSPYFPFWVKTKMPGTYCVSFRVPGYKQLQVGEFTVESGGEWVAIAASTLKLKGGP